MTELVFILDESGSMGGMESDIIGGFNSMLKKQQETEGKTVVSTVMFSDVSSVIHNRVPLEEVKPLTKKDYFTGGTTALLDAVGGAIHHIGMVHKYSDKENRPDKTLFVIMTDGMENASRSYSYDRVRSMIERQKKKYGWEFLFLGANIDSAAEAKRFGIDADFAVNYHCDSIGIEINYKAVNAAVCMAREGNGISKDWRKSIDDDYRNRK